MIGEWHWRHRPGTSGLSRDTWHLVDGRGRDRCTIWATRDGEFTLHTWDERGTGGENFTVATIGDAKRHAVASIVLQGWAPGGWRVRWQ